MILTPDVSRRIITVAQGYLNRSFDYHNFNCIHFVREVYGLVGITLPLINREGLPPAKFHLSEIEFRKMLLGHSVFFRRKSSMSPRLWTHVAIIFSESELIHCSLFFGKKVVVTSVDEFFKIYSLTPELTF